MDPSLHASDTTPEVVRMLSAGMQDVDMDDSAAAHSVASAAMQVAHPSTLSNPLLYSALYSALLSTLLYSTLL